jgi:diguanylate cyclase (GGDEF)-like protein/PAS domain S-box-containing protein
MLVIGFGLNFGSFSFFLTRALSVLDPKSAVPKRVRNTLDTIVGGVVILDAAGKILLVNESFAKSVDRSSEDLLGKGLSELPWRSDGEDHGAGSSDWPWEFAIREHIQKTAIKVHLQTGQDRELSFVVNATPVLDGDERVSGALISFEDITVMEEQRKTLLVAMTDLQTSKEQIRRQNEVLHELAMRDGLTGAFNRRALYERVDAIWPTRNSEDRGLITIMMDVDHFKKLNDQHGHAAGDSVLKDLVKVVSNLVEGQATLARYGGEEFCVIMESATPEEGTALAEVIRAGIQSQLVDPYRVTASIGVSCSLFGAANLSLQLEQADLALYSAKHGGRNAVRCWSPQLAQEAANAEQLKATKLSTIDIEDHPISYHAIVSLNAALSHRLPKIAAHSHRVAEMSVELARGLMPVGKLYSLEIAAMLHDIGLIGMPDCPSNDRSMTPSLAANIKNRVVSLGLEICKAAFNSPDMVDIVRFQNTPYGDLGEAMPLGARIIAVVNAYDELTSELAIEPCTHEQAIDHLRELAGIGLDPILVEKFANSPFGWRPSGLGGDVGMSDQQAIMIGYQLERVIHSFDSRNPIVLKNRLLSLQGIAKAIDMPMIAVLIQELAGEAERKAVADWDSLLPMLHDLIELCLTIQRAYLRTVHPISTNPQVLP